MPTLDELLAYAPTTPAPTQSGLRRRALLENTGLIQRQQEAQNAAPAVASDPYADNWLAQTGRSQVERLASSVPALGVLGAKLVGADEKAAEWAGKFREMDERATMLGPKVQDFSLDNDLAGNASALGYNLAGLVPDLAMTLTGAGVGAVAGRKVAGGLARRGAREIALETASTVAEKAAVRAPGATAQSAAEASQAARIAADAGVADPVAHAARQAGLRTSVEAARAARFENIGSKAGVIAGQFPSLNRENVESLDKDTTDQGDAFATLLGTTGASALGILPVERFLGRFGAEAKAQVAKKAQDFLPRVAKEAAEQGLYEGGNEAVQTAVMRATHQYVGENVNLFDADALNEYLGAFIAGGVLGATVGGGAEATRSVASGVGDFGLGSAKKRIGEWGDMRRAARVEKRKIKAGDEIPLEGAVAKDTVDTFNQHADDLKFDEDLNADMSEGERRVAEFDKAFQSGEDPLLDIVKNNTLPSGFDEEIDTTLKQILMRAVNKDSAIWSDPSAVRNAANSLQRLMMAEELSAEDKQTLIALKDDMKPGTLRDMYAIAPHVAAAAKKLDVEGKWTASKVNPKDVMPEPVRGVLGSQGVEQDAGDLLDRSTDDEEPGGNEDTYGMNHDDPDLKPHDRLSYLTPADADYESVRKQVADYILARGQYFTPEMAAVKLKETGYAAIPEMDNEYGQSAILDLGALATRIQAREGNNTDLRTALLTGLSEAVMSGVPIDFDSIVPGVITIKRTKDQIKLSEGDIAALKGTAAQRAIPAAAVKGLANAQDKAFGANLASRGKAAETLRAANKDPKTARREAEADYRTIADYAKATYGIKAETAGEARKALLAMHAASPAVTKLPKNQRKAAARELLNNDNKDAKRALAKARRDAGREATSRPDWGDDVGFGETDHRLIARKAPPRTSVGNVRDVSVDDKLGAIARKAMENDEKVAAAIASARSDAENVPRMQAIKKEMARIERLGDRATARDKQDYTKYTDEWNRRLDAAGANAEARAKTSVDYAMKRGDTSARAKYSLVKKTVEAMPGTPFEAGVFIGETVLKADTELSDRTRNRLIKRLRNPETGMAERYYQRALAGEFVDVRISEQAWDEYEADYEAAGEEARAEQKGVHISKDATRDTRGGISYLSKVLKLKDKERIVRVRVRGKRASIGVARPDQEGAEPAMLDVPAEGTLRDILMSLNGYTEGATTSSKALDSKAGPTPEPSTDQVAVNARNAKEARRREVIGTAQTDKIWIDELGAGVKDDAAKPAAPKKLAPAPKPSADIDTSSAPAFARAKEAAKAKGAKWVLAAEGVAGSFASRIAAQAKALGRLITADTLDSVQPGDVVYMSVPGANRDYEIKGSVYGLLAKILKRGARVRGDNDYHAHRAHNANSEGVIYDALENAGFTRTENSNFAEWSKNTDDDLQNDDSDTDGTSSEPFDLDKTQAMVDALLKRMGITEPVKLTTTQFEGGKKTARGTYSRSRGAIFINPKFNAAERFETLTHELGHHVMAVQWDKASPETRAAIEADYKKWLKNTKRSKRAGNATLIYASRATFLRSQAALAKDAVKPEGSASKPEAVEYAASFDEYVADGIARALNQNADAQSVVDKFFKSIADQLRKLYDAITGAAKGSKWKAPASIDAWVKSLFDANVAAVRQVSGTTLPAASAAGAVRAANQIVVGHLNPYVGSSNNYRFVSNEVLAAADNATAEKLRRMIEAHEQKANKYKGATRDSIVFEIEYMKAKLASMSGAAVTAGTASTVPPSGTAPTKWTVADFRGLAQFMSSVLPPQARLDLERAFSRPVALAQIRKHFANDPTVLQFLDDSHVGLEATLAAGYLAWQDGALAAGPKGKQAFMDFGDSVAQLFGVSATGDLVERTLSDIADGTVERMRANHDVYSARKGAAADNGKLQKALNWMAEDGPIKRAMSGFWTGIQSRLEATGIPAFRALNAELLLPRGKVSDDAGMIVDIRKQLHRYNRSINNALKDLTDTERNDAVNTLQQAAGKGDAVYDTQPEKVRAAVDGVRAVMRQLAAAASQVEAFGPKFQPPANYFPVVMDIREEGARTKLEALYRKPKFERHVFIAAGYDNKADHTPANFEKAITFLLDAAAGDYEATQGGSSSPTSRSLKRRLSRFVYDHGDANDIREFAALQSKDIDEVFARHLGPMTRMIEFRKRFGEAKVDANGKRTYDPRAKLDDLLTLAKSQGAKKEDLEYAENAVQAALGNYGTDVSPVLSLLSPDLAKRFSGKKTKRTIQIAQAYQNTRLLPLAILSSLVDPIGIAVRTGGDFKSAWTGMRAGMKALFNKDAKQEAIDLLERIGAADEFMPALASHAMFDGPENAWAQRVNRFMFRVNGMSSLVQSTRVMAAYAGEAFLLKHADGAREGDKDSIRYLQELNVSPDDIVEDPNKPGSLVHNADTKEALRRFVDEAILRPNSQQAPLWHRDPFMGLVTQYKGFTYAIYDQITKRMGHELRHGNSWVVLAALAYLPIVLMAELMREWIQYGPDGKPNRKDWGAVDYTMHAAARTGLLGPKADVIGGLRGDIEGNRLPGSSQIGPTASQVSNLVDAFRGYRELDKEVESALPASAAWKHWNDNFGAST